MRKLFNLIGVNILWLPLSMLSDGINALVLPAFIIGRTAGSGQATTLGLMTFSGLLLGMLVQPFAGAASDRLQPRWGRLGTIATGLFSAVVALAVFGFSRGLAGLFAGYLLIQLTSNIIQAAQQGLMPDLIPAQQRGLASGIKTFMDIGGAMLGFVLLGQLLGSGRPGWALMIIALTLAAAFLAAVILVREPRISAPGLLEKPGRSALSRIVHTFHLNFEQDQAFFRLICSRFLFLLGTYGVGRFLLFFVADRLSLDPARAAEQAGSLLASLSFITILAALPSGWASDRWGRTPMMVSGGIISAVGTLLLSIAHSIPAILLFGGLMALGSAAFSTANWAYANDLVPAGEAARYLGLANIGTAGAAAAAGLFGLLVDWANRNSGGSGYPVLFAACALAFLASALVLRGLSQFSNVRNTETSP